MISLDGMAPGRRRGGVDYMDIDEVVRRRMAREAEAEARAEARRREARDRLADRDVRDAATPADEAVAAEARAVAAEARLTEAEARAAAAEAGLAEAEARIAEMEAASEQALAARVAALEAARDAAEARADRMAADLAGYKRRAADELERARAEAVEHVARGVLPVLDDLDRVAAGYDGGDAREAALADGCTQMARKLAGVLEAMGVTRVEPTGEEFDPETSLAVEHAEREGFEPGVVFATYRCGYRLGDRVIRPASVGVAR